MSPKCLTNSVGDIISPLKPGLSDIQARDWYNAQTPSVSELIMKMRSEGKSNVEIAKAASSLRNVHRTQCRDLMANRPLAESLPPNPTWEELRRKYNYDYDAIIEASTRTNPDANKSIEFRRSKGEK